MILCLVVAVVAGAVIAAELTDLLPASKDLLRGWKASGGARLFEGKALYQHIDGGAELFHKHGFQKLCVQDYLKKGSQRRLEARIEIYDMGSVQGAADIFAANTLGVRTSAKFGEACTIDELQIIFKRGRYYVTVTGYETGEEILSSMESLAGAVDGRICLKKSEP